MYSERSKFRTLLPSVATANGALRRAIVICSCVFLAKQPIMAVVFVLPQPYFAATFETPNISLKSGRAWSATAIGIGLSTRKCVNNISAFVTSVSASIVTNDVNGAVVFTVSDNSFVSVWFLTSSRPPHFTERFLLHNVQYASKVSRDDDTMQGHSCVYSRR